MVTEKAKLVLLKAAGGLLTAERLAAMFEQLTGQKPTEEQVKAAREKLAKRS